MPWSLLADLVVLVHLAFIAFTVTGGFLAWRWRWVVALHPPALIWGVWISLAGWICPLTPLENELRMLAGERGYPGSFIERYILPLIYPTVLTREVQWLLALLLTVVNVIAYAGLWRRWRAAQG